MSSYTIPYVTTRTNAGERTVDIYSRLLADRIIYLGTGIDDLPWHGWSHSGRAQRQGSRPDLRLGADGGAQTR